MYVCLMHCHTLKDEILCHTCPSRHSLFFLVSRNVKIIMRFWEWVKMLQRLIWKSNTKNLHYSFTQIKTALLGQQKRSKVGTVTFRPCLHFYMCLNRTMLNDFILRWPPESFSLLFSYTVGCCFLKLINLRIDKSKNEMNSGSCTCSQNNINVVMMKMTN